MQVWHIYVRWTFVIYKRVVFKVSSNAAASATTIRRWLPISDCVDLKAITLR